MKINEVNIIPVKPTDGLVAFASCVIDECIYVSSIGIHKLMDRSGYRITYPTKRIGNRMMNYFHPITKEAGRSIELAVVKKCKEVFEKSDENDDRYSETIDTNSKSLSL